MDSSAFVGRITVFSITGCPHCLHAKQTLQELGLPFIEINLDDYPKRRQWLQNITGKTSVPQIFFNSTHIGGNSELQNLLKPENKSEWNKLLAEIKENPAGSDAPALPDQSEDRSSGSGPDFVCEPDTLSLLLSEFRSTDLVCTHRSFLCWYKHSFTGRDFVHWVVKKNNSDRANAFQLGQRALDEHFCQCLSSASTKFTDDDTLYRLLQDVDSDALNAHAQSQCKPMSADVLGEAMRKLILKLYGSHLTKHGLSVDYAGISADPEFINYKNLAVELSRVDLKDATHNQKLAFFINIYNALVIHANIVRGPPKNAWQRYRFFNGVKYMIGGHEYSLQDIENGVLRANRKGVGQFSTPFSPSDPRLHVALDTHEPRIHFALVCGAKSCPPVKTYSSQNVDTELTLAAQSFLESDDGCCIDADKCLVQLSMILKWYRVDFGNSDAEVLQFILDHLPEGEKKKQLSTLVEQGRYKVVYQPYDWSINT